MMTHDTAEKGGRVKSYNKVKWKVLFSQDVTLGWFQHGNIPNNAMRFQRPVEKSTRKPGSTKRSTTNTYFTQMGKSLDSAREGATRGPELTPQPKNFMKI